MAIWYKQLYMGQKAANMYEKIHKSVEEGKYLPGIYLITIAENPADQLEIYNSISLYMPALKRRLMPIVGAACGYKEAISLFQTMAEDVYQKTGGFMLRKYFEEQIELQQQIEAEQI